MGDSALDHDRDTGAPDRTTGEPMSRVLQEALARLRLEGAVFLRAEYREPWAYESFTTDATAKALRGDTDRVLVVAASAIAAVPDASTAA